MVLRMGGANRSRDDCRSHATICIHEVRKRIREVSLINRGDLRTAW